MKNRISVIISLMSTSLLLVVSYLFYQRQRKINVLEKENNRLFYRLNILKKQLFRMQLENNIVITNPKGEFLDSTKDSLLKNGYQFKDIKNLYRR